MRYFPLFMDTAGLNCLVVGAGEVAARKVELLLKTQAQVTVVAPQACNTIQLLAQSNNIQLQLRPFAEQDLQHIKLAYIATDSPELNFTIAAQAKAQGILTNVVDEPAYCDFITPSIVDRSPIVVAISSGGVAPVLLRYLRQKLETWIPANIAKLGEFFERFRERVKQGTPDVDARRRFWETVMDGGIAELVMQGAEKQAGELLLQALTDENHDKGIGQVYMIGAGPGDPDLLTFRALRLMQKADVVVYDRLVSAPILELVRRDAEKIYAGKAQSQHTLPQQDINLLLVELAKQNKLVVRLKGGDPFIFGRGGEEMEALCEHNIPFQIVPGITAASGAACYAGIPLTHRDHAQSVIFATAHLKDNRLDLDWPSLINSQQTLVFYMGTSALPIICEKLVEYGMEQHSPIAIIQWATRPEQKVVVGTLITIQEQANKAEIGPPSLIIVGTVTSLHSALNWFQPNVANNKTSQLTQGV
jgi:uroporphyrin-III C-methyltransferase/precorrin-2 dehydrogenase/sirohydrochlorin ferrochelatase